MVIRPACEFGGHCCWAKSRSLHSVSTRGLPKSPGGASKAMFFATSLLRPRFSLKWVKRSGCPPARVSEAVVLNSSIVRAARAGPAPRASTKTASSGTRMALRILLSPLLLAALVGLRPVLLHAFAVALGLVLLADDEVAGGRFAGALDDGWSRRHRAGPMALVGGLAGDLRWQLEEAAAFAGVVDLHQRAAFVFFGCEGFVGEEEDVDAAGGHGEESRVEGPASGRDQFLPARVAVLVDVGAAVGVVQDQFLEGGEEDPAVRQDAEAVRRQRRVEGKAFVAGPGVIAGGADQAGAGAVAEDLQVVEGVDAGERFGAQEGGVVAARRGLEVTRTAGGGGADRVDDQWVVRFEGGDEHRGTGV